MHVLEKESSGTQILEKEVSKMQVSTAFEKVASEARVSEMQALEKVHSTQQSFRVVMDAMARPGKVAALPPVLVCNDYPRINTPMGVLVEMFVDQASTFYSAGDPDLSLERAIVINTHARRVPSHKADFLVIPESTGSAHAEEVIGCATGGSLVSPETGATVLMGCKRIGSQNEEEALEADSLHWVSIEGPGVETSHVFGIDRIDWAWARNRREDEFPCGIEIVLVDEEGRLVAIPRTSFVSLLSGERDVN